MSSPKLYLNENLSWRIARALCGYGYDVVSSHEVNMNGEPDDEQFAFAVDQHRAVVTNNFRDFVNLHTQYIAQHQDHYGVILTTKIPVGQLIHRLRTLCGTVSDDELMNQIRWLNEFE